MNILKQSMTLSLKKTFGILCLLVTAPTIAMITPAYKRQMAKRAIFLKKKQSSGLSFSEIKKIIHSGPITSCALSKNGKVLVTAAQGPNNNIIISNAETGEQLQAITFTDGKIEQIIISPNGSRILSVSTKKIDKSEDENETLTLWDSKTGKQIETLATDKIVIYDIKFSSDETRITFGSQNIAKDINNPEETTFTSIADSNTGNIILKHKVINNDTDATINNATINPNGNTMVIKSDNALLLYNLSSGQKITQLKGPNQKIYNIKYSSNGTRIVAQQRNEDNTLTIFIWDGIKGNLITSLNTPYATQVTLNSNGTILATFGINNDNISNIWVANVSPQITTKYTAATSLTAAFSLEFSPDDSMILAAGTGNPNIIVLNASTGKQIHAFNAVPDGVDADFSSDSLYIQSHHGSDDTEEKCTITLWNIGTKKEIQKIAVVHELLDISSNFLTIVKPDPTNNKTFILLKGRTSIPPKKQPSPAPVKANWWSWEQFKKLLTRQ